MTPLRSIGGIVGNGNVLWLRIAYWVAAVADFAIAVLVLVPDRMGVDEFVYPMGLMSAVAFSWGVLLVVADREPEARKWVIAPTILVVFLLGVAAVFAGLNDLIPSVRMIATLVAVAVVLGILITAHVKNRA
jgi:hypothetical protein